MKKLIFSTVFLLKTTFISSFTYAADCNELLQLGYMNINHSVSASDTLVSAYQNLCSESYSSASTGKKKGMNFSFDFLKKFSGSLGGTWENTLTQTAWSKVCNDKSLKTKLSTYQSLNSSEISHVAMNAWTECLALNERGLKPNFNATSDLTGLTGTLYWNGSWPIYFTGVDNNGLGTASCSVTYYDGKQYTTKAASSTTTFALDSKSASFNCKRKTAVDSQGRIIAQGTRLTFKTSEGKIDFDLSPITIAHVEARQINSIYSQLNSLSSNLSNAQSSINNLNTKVNSITNNITTLDKTAKSLTAATRYIFADKCPDGWQDYDLIGFIGTVKAHSILGVGGHYGGNYWYWAHSRLCYRP